MATQSMKPDSRNEPYARRTISNRIDRRISLPTMHRNTSLPTMPPLYSPGGPCSPSPGGPRSPGGPSSAGDPLSPGVSGLLVPDEEVDGATDRETPGCSPKELLGKLVSALCSHAPFTRSSSKESAAEATPERRENWYSVRTKTNQEVYTVRAIANPQEGGHVRGTPSFNLERTWSKREAGSRSQITKTDDDSPPIRSQSVPHKVERFFGLDDGEEPVSEDNICRLCCTEAADVVLLPCRHGGICYRCFRRILFMKPLHRGGCTCPICRRHIREAVRINDPDLQKSSAAFQYGVRIGVR